MAFLPLKTAEVPSPTRSWGIHPIVNRHGRVKVALQL
jgi:hypothetical protein